MWTKPQHSEPSRSPISPPAATTTAHTVIPSGSPSTVIGSSLRIKGEVKGNEALQIDGKIEGPILLTGHELTVGSYAELISEVQAGAVTVYGKIVGNVQAHSRVDIKRDGSITGAISTARISIEHGAHFKGRIEIDPAKSGTKVL